MKDLLSLYLHIPFCPYKCLYCDFNAYSGLENLRGAYVGALARESRLWEGVVRETGYSLATLYFGGGTPSLLQPSALATILEACLPWWPLKHPLEVSLEANPGTVNEASLRAYRSLGVNRLSLGVQSFDDRLLLLLGRHHTIAQAYEAFGAARRADFANINLDLMYGLPEQSLEDWQRTLQQALALEPEHLSLYALSFEKETPLARSIRSGHLPTPDPDLAADMYLLAEELLDGAGYIPYEISNWAKPGALCRHNLTYWRSEAYLGLGAGAHSFFLGYRFANIASPRRYVRLLQSFAPPSFAGDCATHPSLPWHPTQALGLLESVEKVDPDRGLADAIILGLRLNEGVSLTALQERFGGAVRDHYTTQVRELEGWGLLSTSEGRLRLTARGRLLSNEVFWRFLPQAGNY